jgi:hypothetical protein
MKSPDDEQAELVGSSVLTQVEMAATLAKAARLHCGLRGKNAGDFRALVLYTRLSVPTSLERASRLAGLWLAE